MNRICYACGVPSEPEAMTISERPAFLCGQCTALAMTLLVMVRADPGDLPAIEAAVNDARSGTRTSR